MWSAKIKMPYKNIHFRAMKKRWGSCTISNNIIINVEAVKLSYTLIDYLIIYELCHTKVKDHSKKFWAELSKYLPNWKQLDEKMKNLKM